MKFVERHERAWGMEYYKGRPTLAQLMNAKVVAFWHPTTEDMNHTATMHKSVEEIDQYVTHLVWHTAKNGFRCCGWKPFCRESANAD